MTLGDVIYSRNRMEPGKQYVAFSFNNPLEPLWQGRLVHMATNFELMVVEQPDGKLMVAWDSTFADGVRSIYHELTDGPLPRVPILPLPRRQAREAALILLRRTDAERSEEPYLALLYPCGEGWHYTEEPNQLLDVAELRHYCGEAGLALAQVTRTLMGHAGMLCEHCDNS